MYRQAIKYTKRQGLSLLLSAMTGLMTVSPPGLAQEVAKAQHLVDQWLSVERQSNQLEADWQQQKPLLQQRLALLKIEKQQLQSLLSEKSTDSSQVEQQRLALINEQSQLEQQQSVMDQAIHTLLSGLQGLQTQLPPPLSEQWQQESAALAQDASSSEQLQSALLQLSKLAEFNQRISVLESTLVDPQGETLLVRQLYLGASHAWFVSVDGSQGGTGQPGPQGWQWQFSESSANQEITRAIAIFEKQQEADFVRLPIQLSQAGVR